MEKWPDPKGKHPVVYVAAGSHAGYFTSSDKPLESLLQPGRGRRLVAAITRLREESLVGAEEGRARAAQDERPSPSEPMAKERPNGQGMAVDPGKPQGASPESEIETWNAVLLDDGQAWVKYRGLWGYRTRLSDESGPPGPKWERPGHKAEKDSSFPEGCAGCRLYWADPLGWLEKAQEVGRAEEAGA